MNNSKKLIIGIICSLFLLIGGTYAAWNLLTEKTEVTMIIGEEQISFNSGANITESGIVPVYNMEEGIIKDIEIYKENENYTAGIDLYLNLTTFPTAFASSSFRWALYKNNNYISSGDFLGTKQGNTIKLTSYTQKLNSYDNRDNYKLYLWIDANFENSYDMMNKTFKVNLYGQASFYDGNDFAEPSTPNEPDLVDGMIPIRYNYIIDEWEKADTSNSDNNWYDYDSKKWANAVLVTSESRDRYMNASVGTTIYMEDILAYYVWIPRYKYLLFNVNSEESEPREIQIVFEKKTDPISNGNKNGEYLSHPAFWWDNNSDNIREEDGSEELSGIWVGKFETTFEDDNPQILPNILSTFTWKYGMPSNSISTLYSKNKKIQSTTYLTEIGVNNSDAHMMKNTEWGVVVYLTYSRYGINKNMNNNDDITGRYGNYTYNDFLVSNNEITLTKSLGTGTSTSTTGNVYGVYDMNACGNEIMMSFSKASSTDSTPYLDTSGFNTTTIPESKYYDLYEFGYFDSDYSRRILGDATGEIYGWSSLQGFIYYYQSNPSRDIFFKRGGASEFYGTSGSDYAAGGGHKSYSSRCVLLTP